MPLRNVGLEVRTQEERRHSSASHDHNPPHELQGDDGDELHAQTKQRGNNGGNV